jgi:hypothetical protein
MAIPVISRRHLEGTIATEQNTGPDYYTVNNIHVNSPFVDNLIKVSPNPAADHVLITINIGEASDVKVEVFDLQGKKVMNLVNESIPAGDTTIARELEPLAAGAYTIHASNRDTSDGIEKMQIVKLIKQ